MKKSELIIRMHEASKGVTLQTAERAVNAILERFCQALKEGGRIEIRGFGSFYVVERNARIGKNPRTGEKVAIEDKMAIKFRTAKELNRRMNDA